MYDLFYTSAFFIHGSLLVGLLIWFCQKIKMPKIDIPFFTMISLWCVLVFASHGSSIINGLGSLIIYIPMTFISLLFLLFVLNSFWKIKQSVPLISSPKLNFPLPKSYKTRKFLLWFLYITLGLFALISFILGMSVYPDNADSMIYRLPRALFYISNDNFLHPFTSLDNRLVFYPLNGVALYIPFALYGMTGTWFAFPSFIAWAMLIYTTYRFSKELGAPHLWSVFSAWLIGLTPSILAQATSTNDEILSAVAFLIALYMGWKWLVCGRQAYFLFAGISTALSAGTKLHIVFLIPIILIATFILLWKIKSNPLLFKEIYKSINWKVFFTTLFFMFVIFTPFLLYNYISSDRWYFFDSFKNDVFNLSANIKIGFQNLLIYFSQMILSPIADLNMWPIANDRQAFNNQLNEIFSPLIKPLLSNNPDFYHLGYRFVGITLPVSVRFVEFSLWSAFIWILWPLQIILSLKHKFSFRIIFALLASTPLIWILFWSFTTLYMEGTATYFTFYLICAAPASIMVFSKIKNIIWSDIRWVAIVLVTITNLIICFNLVMYSGFRALPDLYYSKTLPYDWLLTEKEIIKEIRLAKRIRIVQTHEKTPYFGYMHWNPRAQFYSPFLIKDISKEPNPTEILQILPVSSMNRYGFMPIKIPNKRIKGLTFLGLVRAIGREAIFAVGNNIEKRHPNESNYIVLQAYLSLGENGKYILHLNKNPMGFSKYDELEFKYQLKNGNKIIYEKPYDKDPTLSVELAKDPYKTQLTLTTFIRTSWNKKELTKATYNLGIKGEWLPEGPAY